MVSVAAIERAIANKATTTTTNTADRKFFTASPTSPVRSGSTTTRTRTTAPRPAPPPAPAPAAPQPTTPPPAPTPAAEPARQLDLSEIQAALEAISAMFNLQEGELSAEMEAARTAFQFLQENLFRSRDEALAQNISDLAGRGLLRSGITLRQQSDINERASTAVGQAAAEKSAKERAITGQLSALEAAEKAQRAAEARKIAREQVNTKEAIARALELV